MLGEKQFLHVLPEKIQEQVRNIRKVNVPKSKYHYIFGGTKITQKTNNPEKIFSFVRNLEKQIPKPIWMMTKKELMDLCDKFQRKYKKSMKKADLFKIANETLREILTIPTDLQDIICDFTGEPLLLDEICRKNLIDFADYAIGVQTDNLLNSKIDTKLYRETCSLVNVMRYTPEELIVQSNFFIELWHNLFNVPYTNQNMMDNLVEKCRNVRGWMEYTRKNKIHNYYLCHTYIPEKRLITVYYMIKEDDHIVKVIPVVKERSGFYVNNYS